jgi:hypothetical protein
LEGFISWDVLKEYTSFVAIVFMVVEFTKEIAWIKDIKTKYWSAFVSFVLLTSVNIYGGEFTPWNLLLYALSSVAISLGSNGLANFNKDKQVI